MIATAEPTPAATPAPLSANRRAQVLALLERLVPLAAGLVGTLRTGVIVGVVTLIWLGVWMLVLAGWPVAVGVPLLILAALPLPVLIWFWSGLGAVVALPETVARLWADTGDEVTASLGRLTDKAPPRGRLGSAAGSLWRLGGMVNEARDLLGSSLGLGALFNPLALVVGVAALVWLLMVLFVGAVLVLVAVF